MENMKFIKEFTAEWDAERDRPTIDKAARLFAGTAGSFEKLRYFIRATDEEFAQSTGVPTNITKAIEQGDLEGVSAKELLAILYRYGLLEHMIGTLHSFADLPFDGKSFAEYEEEMAAARIMIANRPD